MLEMPQEFAARALLWICHFLFNSKGARVNAKQQQSGNEMTTTEIGVVKLGKSLLSIIKNLIPQPHKTTRCFMHDWGMKMH